MIRFPLMTSLLVLCLSWPAANAAVEPGSLCESAAVQAARLTAFKELGGEYPVPEATDLEAIQKDESYRVTLETGDRYVVEVHLQSYFCAVTGVRKEGA